MRSAVYWRSGGQIITQLLSWASTLMVIRILNPADYGLFAMTQAVIAFMGFLNGHGLISALVQSETIDMRRLRQAYRCCELHGHIGDSIARDGEGVGRACGRARPELRHGHSGAGRIA